jgi:hypothetical protein
MSGQLQKNRIPTHVLRILAEIKEVWGPPPVLSSEDAKAYETILLNLIECIDPENFMDRMLVKEVADSTWEQLRYTRHKTLVMERRFRDQRKLEAQRRKAAAEKKEALAKRLSESKAERATEPEEALDGLVDEVDAILLEPATEHDHARALEVGIRYYEHLDNLQMTTIARRYSALDLLDRLRERRNRFIDATAGRGLGGLRAYEVLGSPEDALDEFGFVPECSSSETNQSEPPPHSSMARER